MHLLCDITIQSNLELKTQPKQLSGPLLLDIALPNLCKHCTERDIQQDRSLKLFGLSFQL
jgi:hypothetical protein